MNCEIPDEPRVEGACGWAMCVFLFLLRSVANTDLALIDELFRKGFVEELHVVVMLVI